MYFPGPSLLSFFQPPSYLKGGEGRDLLKEVLCEERTEGREDGRTGRGVYDGGRKEREAKEREERKKA